MSVLCCPHTCRCIPVSYTHLDVYKRQLHRLTSIPQNTHDYQEELNTIKYIAVKNGYNPDLINKLHKRILNTKTPVSYTHLDVYKRQVTVMGCGCVWRRLLVGGNWRWDSNFLQVSVYRNVCVICNVIVHLICCLVVVCDICTTTKQHITDITHYNQTTY